MTANQIKSYILLLFLFLLLPSAYGSNIKKIQARLDFIKDSLEHKLSTTTNPEERYNLLLNISDISTNSNNNYLSMRRLYDESFKNKNEEIQIEALRNLSNRSELDSLLLYYTFSEHLKPGPLASGLRVLLLNRIDIVKNKSASYSERSLRLQELINEYKEYTKNTDIQNTDESLYSRIRILNNICNLMSKSVTTGLYVSYLEELLQLTSQLPQENYFLKGSVFVNLALLYTYQGEHAKAVDIDNQLIEYIHWLEKTYKERGRIYRKYHTNYYAIYRRMLSNYPALSIQEVEHYYSLIKDIADKDYVIYENFYNIDPRPNLYYHLAHKNYKEAAIYVDKINTKEIEPHILLRYKIEIARALGQKDKLLAYLDNYIIALDSYNKARANEKIQEFQILYDVEATKTQNIELTLKAKELEVEAAKRNLYLGIGVIIFLLVLFTVVLISYINNKKLNKELAIARDQAQNSDKIKTIFIQNINHEIRTPLNAIVGFSQLIASSISEDETELKEYAKIVESNNDLLLKIFYNILQLSDLESGLFKYKQVPCFPNRICESALDSAKLQQVKANTTLIFTSTIESSFSFLSSPEYIQQILSHLLLNAIKNTKQGSISVSASIDQTNQNVVFTVTDTGVGISPEKKDLIFKRFEKIDSFSSGNGLGLYICKLLAQKLGGDIHLDTNYTTGAKFILTLPKKES